MLQKLQTSPRERRERGLFVCEGMRLIRELSPEEIVSVYCSDSFAKEIFSGGGRAGETGGADAVRELTARAIHMSDRVFAACCDTKTPQGILAVARSKKWAKEEVLTPRGGRIRLLVLESIQNPGNLGTLLRTGEAAGLTGVIMSRDCVDIYNPKVIRGSMGSFHRVPFVYEEDLSLTLADLREAGITTFATHLHADADAFDVAYPEKMALLVGNEGNGLSEELAMAADTRIRIPMAGRTESLNAAMAASILLYEAYRQECAGR